MNMSLRAVPCTALLALLPAIALASTPIDETHPLPAGGTVAIENIKGSIKVRAWDRPEVHIGGTLGEGVEKLSVDRSGERLEIEVEYPDSDGWFGMGGDRAGPTHLEVRVPQGASLDLESVSAEVDVEGTQGASLQVESVSGSVSVRDAGAEKADIETVSGSQEIAIATPDLAMESVSGSIRAQGQLGGRVHAEAVSGSIRVQGATLSDFNASTVSGSIELDAALAQGARVQVESLSGTVKLALPASTSARVDASTFSGSIRSDVGEVERSEYGPGSTLEATIGGGDARISVETFSGNLRLELE